jgi:hypothetical protein
MRSYGRQAKRKEQVFPFSEADARETALIWIDRLPKGSRSGMSGARVHRVFEDTLALFAGDFRGYRECDTRYHNLDHTLYLIPPFCQLALSLCMKYPNAITTREVELGVIAVLLHDSGYIREEHDRAGTGGKFTFQHIHRSVVFSRSYLPSIGYADHDLDSVEQMIRCTGVSVDPSKLTFSSLGCRLLGHALGVADLLAQMSDLHYNEKLGYLFLEYQESYEYEGRQRLEEMNVVPFRSARDLIEKTPGFYRNVVLGRFAAMGDIHRFLDDPRTGINPYLEKIEKNIAKI